MAIIIDDLWPSLRQTLDPLLIEILQLFIKIWSDVWWSEASFRCRDRLLAWAEPLIFPLNIGAKDPFFITSDNPMQKWCHIVSGQQRIINWDPLSRNFLMKIGAEPKHRVYSPSRSHENGFKQFCGQNLKYWPILCLLVEG